MPKRLTNQEFIIRAKNTHRNRYDYSLVEYINNSTKVKIICKKHGVFEQRPINHTTNKQGCKKCGLDKQSKRQLYTTDIFIKKSKKVHGVKYDYSLVEYKDYYNKVDIICKKHGTFKQIPSDHMRGIGCIHCQESKGEREIRQLLQNNKIEFIPQKIFEKCKNINPLPFDFYLPKYNMCIEFDGEHHFKIKEYWGGEKEFLNIQKKDNIKNNFCKNTGIKLLRIKYTDKIKEKLNFI